jgi:hypothetical protein
MKNWIHTHLPKVIKTTLGPLGVKQCDKRKGIKVLSKIQNLASIVAK